MSPSLRPYGRSGVGAVSARVEVVRLLRDPHRPYHSAHTLAMDLHLSVGTIRKALNSLQADGISQRHKRRLVTEDEMWSLTDR
jgi:DNA-binding transcriptional regulator YhcF (GntR family)